MPRSFSIDSKSRIVFRSRATVIEIDTMRTRTTYAALPARPDGFVDLIIDGHVVAHSPTSGGLTRTIDMSTGTVDQEVGAAGTTQFAGLPGAMKTAEIWLPHNENAEILELRTNASVEPELASGLPTWLHHGSSISHGSNDENDAITRPLPDALHPDPATHQLMGERFARLAFAEDGPLALPAG